MTEKARSLKGPAMNLKKSFCFKIFFLAVFFFALVQCRAEHSEGLSEPLDTQSEEDWYDMDGVAEKCVTPPATCPAFDYEKEFVDSCVNLGGRSKTCGCAMRCSNKIEYTRLKPKPESEETKVAATLTTGCSETSRQLISDFAAKRRPGSDQDRCIEDFLCQGTTSRCEPEVVPTVASIRQIARNGCSREAVGSLCANGFSESLQCPDGNIAQLTSVQKKLADKADPARRCIRNVLCFDSENNCEAGQKAEALRYKNLVNKDGCEYWLRNLCSLDN